MNIGNEFIVVIETIMTKQNIEEIMNGRN